MSYILKINNKYWKTLDDYNKAYKSAYYMARKLKAIHGMRYCVRLESCGHTNANHKFVEWSRGWEEV